MSLLRNGPRGTSRLTALALCSFASCADAPADDLSAAPRVAPLVAKAPGATGGMTTRGEAIVGFQAGMMPPLQVGGLLGGYRVLRVVKAGNFALVAADDLDVLRDDLFVVLGLAGLSYVEDNGLFSASLVPNDTQYYRQYGPKLMGAETVWNTQLGSASVKVAVLDSGLLETHTDFAAARIGDGYDYVNRDGTPDDRCGHGTHVAGTIAASINNGKGVAGMAHVTIIPHKVLDLDANGDCLGSTAAIAEAIYASRDAGASVISMSLGASSGATTMKNAVDDAWSRGILVVAAAGNDYGGAVSYPAAYDSVIAVSAVDAQKRIADYSNLGAKIEVAGPGSDVISTWKDGGYAYASGTSMAAPHVAGALALAKGCAGTTSGQTLRQKLRDTAEDLGTAGKDNTFGYGLARVDRLVAAVCTTTTPPPTTPTNPDAGVTTLTNNQTVDLSVGAGQDAFYKIVVPSGATNLVVSIDGPNCGVFGCSAEADLSTRFGSKPTDGAFDCRPGTSGSDETCTVASPSAGGTYIRVKGVSGTTALKLNAKFTAATTTTPPSGQPEAGTTTIAVGATTTVSIAANQGKHFAVWVPAGKSALDVITDGPGCGLLGCSFDADLYLRRGTKATTTTYDCASKTSGSDESCSKSAPASGWWYVLVQGYSGSGSLTLKASTR